MNGLVKNSSKKISAGHLSQPHQRLIQSFRPRVIYHPEGRNEPGSPPTFSLFFPNGAELGDEKLHMSSPSSHLSVEKKGQLNGIIPRELRMGDIIAPRVYVSFFKLPERSRRIKPAAHHHPATKRKGRLISSA